jgi:hypothetical protein
MEDQDLESLDCGFPTGSSNVRRANAEGVSYHIVEGIYMI